MMPPGFHTQLGSNSGDQGNHRLQLQGLQSAVI